MRFDWLAAIVLFLLSSTSLAWDQHHFLTSQSLVDLKELDNLVPVTPLERFLEKAFGTSCSWERARDTVFDGVGSEYRVLYVDEMSYGIAFDWPKGISHQLNHPRLDPDSTQRLGGLVRARDVLAVYSDEPDWGLDDDVARLRGKGVSQAGEGMSTRMLRHFWYQGESVAGVDFSKDQETDQRAQRYYELALVAFAAEEPYWGYRFLANALHYVQDVTQPFHTRPLPSMKMIDMLGVIRAKLCEGSPAPRCKIPGLSLGTQVIANGWIVAAYHSTFEDFARGLLGPTHPYSSYDYLVDSNGWYEKTQAVEALPWKGTGPLLELKQVIAAEQRVINSLANAVGDDAYEAFGTKIRYDVATTQETIRLTSQNESEGYRLALISPTAGSNITTTGRQDKALLRLVADTDKLFLRAGIWSRALVRQTLETAGAREAVEKLRSGFERACATGAL